MRATLAPITPIVRIVLFILSGALAGAGWIDGETTDLIRSQETIGLVVMGLTGAWYATAKWRGWTT